jgi:NADPH:quinone reductase
VRSLVCQAFDAPLAIVEEPDPAPGPGEVLVGVRAANVSFVDRLIVSGRYQVRPPLPFTPGAVAAGSVLALGEGCSSVGVGDRVVALLSDFGAWTSHVVVPAWAVQRIPTGVSDEAAAGALEAYGTAGFALEERATLREGESVLVLGAGGAVGAAAVETAVALGARVVAVTSSPDYWTGRAHRPEVVLARSTDPREFRDELRRLFPGGLDVVVDPVGGVLAQPALRSLGYGGRYLVVGFASGDIPTLPANQILLRNRSVLGVEWRGAILENPAGLAPLLAAVLGRMADSRTSSPIPNRHDFAGLVGALAVPGPSSGLVRTVVSPD